MATRLAVETLGIRFLATVMVSLAGALAPINTASSADVALPVEAPPVPVQSGGWTYTFTPYAWLPALNGSSTVRGQTTDVDASFVDLVDRKIPKDLFALMGSFEARQGRFSIFTDFMYMKLGAGGGAATSVTLRPLVGASLAADAELKFQMVVTEVSATYEVARWGTGTFGSGTALDVLGGGRFWWQKADLDLAVFAGLTLGGFNFAGSRAFASSGSVTWADPLVGLRLRLQFAPGHEFSLSGDVGGFGVGSEFSWQAIGAYSFHFARAHNIDWSGMIGYRALYVDYGQGNGTARYEYDMLQHGPIIGLNMRF